MRKYLILGIVNIALCIFYGFILVTSGYSFEPLDSIENFLRLYSPNVVLLVSLGFNAFLAYKLIIKKSADLPYYLYIVLSFSTVMWLLLLFVGYFVASQNGFILFSIILVAAIFLLVRSSSRKVAVSLSLATLVVCIVVLFSSYEEDYCLTKASKTDPGGSQLIAATKDDQIKLKGLKVKEGDQLAVNWRTHMICHETFRFSDAFKERWSLGK